MLRAASTPRLRVPLLLIGALLAATPLLAAGADQAQTEAELRKITDKLNDLSVWLGGADRKRAQWQRQIQSSDRQVAKLSRQVDSAAEKLDRIRADQAALEKERSKLESQRQAQANRIGEHLASAYRINGQDFIKLLLNQQSPEALNRMVRYHRYFTAAHMQALHDYRDTLEQMAQNAERLAERESRAEQQQAALKREQIALVKEREERKTLLARLNTEAKGKEAERARLMADRKRLESLLAELKRRSKDLDGRAFAARKGSLPWPVHGRVRNAFGQPRAEGRLTWHGLMLAASEGTPITAVFRGRVVFADWLRGFGLLTIVDHGGGYMTLYGHADALAKKVGDWVESGEVIARTGRSGGISTPGLYFEVRHDGKAADPVVWLGKR